VTRDEDSFAVIEVPPAADWATFKVYEAGAEWLKNKVAA
jgi:hypothetical protein